MRVDPHGSGQSRLMRPDDMNSNRLETLFPTGGGETGALIRSFDWSKTSLGCIGGWPQSLQTALDIVLQSPMPMVMLWGQDGVMLYNDAYSILAGGRHPRLLGSPVLDGWPEVADFNRRVMEVGLGGGTLSFHDQHLVLRRNGAPEDVWMELNYSPILGENGLPAGVLAIVVETTQRVKAQKQLESREEQLRLAQEAGGIGVFDLDIATNLLSVTPEFCRLYGIEQADVIPAPEIERLVVAEDSDLRSDQERREKGQIATSVEYRVFRPKCGDVRWIGRKAEFVRDADGKPLRLVGAVQDLTERKKAEEALRISKERLSYALDAAGMVGTWDWHVPSDTFYSDAKFAELFSVDPEKAAKGTPLADFLIGIHPEDLPKVVEAVDHAMKTGERYSQEYRLIQKDGTIRWVVARGECLYDGDGRPARFPGAAIDVTDRRRAEDALRESENRFRVMADSAPALIWASDEQGRVIFANRRYEVDFGLSPELILQEGWRRIVHAEDVASFHAAFIEALESRSPFKAEVRVWDKDRRLRWLRCEGVPRFDAAGHFLGHVGCNVDITEVRLVTEALEAEVEQRTRELASIWRVSRDLFCICGLDGYCQSVNPAWTDALGYAPEELVGLHCLALIHPEDASRARTEFEPLGRAGIGQTDLRIRARDGSYRWYNWTGVTEGEVFYAAGRDITARKELEEQLRQSQKMEAIGQLTGGIAHDFNNLLTGIIGSLELLQIRMAQGRHENLERYAKAAVSSANKAASLTHRLLAFSRRQPLDPHPVNANQLVASMADLLHRTTGEAIELELATAEDLWLTLCDPNQLENALLNLVINARDAMPNGGKLVIKTANGHFDRSRFVSRQDATQGDYVVLSVSDTGVGMTPEVMARAFDPFFTTKPIGQGTGLGLSMIYGFAKQSEGHVLIESEVGKGTTVRIHLPRHRGSVQAETASDGLADTLKAGAGEVVLVVEDEPVVRGLIVDVLKELGYGALEAADGPGGLQILESKHHIDLLVTDVGLPGINGRQLADQARAHRPNLKVLFMTGYAENAAISSGFLDAGMEMITKPFAVDALTRRIRDMIEGSHAR
jgi:PAS domain S-box-containing protein